MGKFARGLGVGAVWLANVPALYLMILFDSMMMIGMGIGMGMGSKEGLSGLNGVNFENVMVAIAFALFAVCSAGAWVTLAYVSFKWFWADQIATKACKLGLSLGASALVALGVISFGASFFVVSILGAPAFLFLIFLLWKDQREKAKMSAKVPDAV